MIYDHFDVSTKYYVAARVRDWVRVKDNALILLQNRRVRELTQSDLSFNSEDDIIWSVLYLIGVGLLRYSVSNDGKVFNLAMTLNWKKPSWLFDELYRSRLKNHLHYLMELESEGRISGLQPTALIPSLEMSKYRRNLISKPKEPVINNLVHENQLIAHNRKLLAGKRAFHRGR
jgi:hypothetical protein